MILARTARSPGEEEDGEEEGERRRRVTAGSRGEKSVGRHLPISEDDFATGFQGYCFLRSDRAPRRLCGLCAYRRYIDNGVWVPPPLFSALHTRTEVTVRPSLERCAANRPLNMLMERVLVDKPWLDVRREARGGGGRRRREFELNCKTLLRWKWAAKIIERLMGFLEWRSEWQKFKRPLEFQKLGLSVCLCVCIFRCEGGRQRGGGVKPFPDGV